MGGNCRRLLSMACILPLMFRMEHQKLHSRKRISLRDSGHPAASGEVASDEGNGSGHNDGHNELDGACIYNRRVDVNSRIKTTILIIILLFTSAFSATYAVALDKRHPAHFLPEERRIINEYYRRANTTKKGLPPGLAKRGGKLPPGLQKHLEKNGQLPPGLQKRLEPLPSALDGRLPSIPEYWERVLVERDVILLDRRTNRILDIIENVIGLASGQ
jgi:hypothetical protein